MEIINCIDLAFEVEKCIENFIEKIGAKDKIFFVILYTTNNPATLTYIANKKKKAATLGIKAMEFFLDEGMLEETIKQFNQDENCHGIIVQLPLLNKNPLEVVQLIDPKKDIDGLHPMNIGLLSYGYVKKNFIPCTALGVLKVIANNLENNLSQFNTNKHKNLDLSGKNVVIIGRSNIVGKPLSYLLTNYNATVTLAHSKTSNLEEISYKADIVVLAVGKPKFFTQKYFNSNAMIIDVGINYLDNKICGDADFENLKVAKITPVPKGIGRMTVIYLMFNVVKAYAMQNNYDFDTVF